ncbi:MAG: anhydro-N-acetylmuramic acid kinase AnmK [Ignavibacterium sp.]
MKIEQLLKIKQKKTKYIIGLISGTSLDGVDAVLIKVSRNGINTKFKELGFITYPFPSGMKKLILKNAEYKSGNVTDICRLNFLIALVYVDAIKRLLKQYNFPLSKIDLIGSHGQTIHHLPKKEKLFGYYFNSTLQIGDPSVIAKITGITTIGDFRVADMALGGEGAPLVPYFDYITFHSTNKNRALLNIGGISNFSILNKNKNEDDTIAFDCGPGNMLIDFLTRKFYNLEFDKDGKIAKKGKVNLNLLKDIFNQDFFIKQKPPKSTGREYYGKNFLTKLLSKYKKLSKEDLIATITNYTAYAIYFNYKIFIEQQTKIDELIVSGGGASNKTLMKFIQEYFGDKVKVKNANDFGISADSKEAICFAVLANETLMGNPTNIPSVTGAKAKTILGKICLP